MTCSILLTFSIFSSRLHCCGSVHFNTLAMTQWWINTLYVVCTFETHTVLQFRLWCTIIILVMQAKIESIQVTQTTMWHKRIQQKCVKNRTQIESDRESERERERDENQNREKYTLAYHDKICGCYTLNEPWRIIYRCAAICLQSES